MPSEILINVRPAETRVAFLENGILVDFLAESNRNQGLAGSIFRGRVNRVLPGMQAAFVDIGLDRAAFLYVGDVRPEVGDGSLVFGEDVDRQSDPNAREGTPAPTQDESIKPPIQDLLSEGQDLIVQVAKDPIGTKGARITTHLSLPGRYVVYMPTVSHLGISRRIEDPVERDRLRAIVEKLKPSRGGLIVRTAGEGASEESLKADIEYLVLLSEDVQRNYQKKKAVGLIHKELPMELRSIRDLLNEDVEKVVVDDGEVQKKVVRFISQFMPKLKTRVDLYEGAQPLFDQYRVDLEISRSLGRKVWLKSGGYIIIDEAEALVVIDVNTGSYVGKKDLEDTILKTNLEAVQEISHQLRIRNCGGIIIIDFIDMERADNREKVLSALKEELKRDRARTNVSSMSALGLVEMTRKRTRPSLVRTMCEPCDYCEGRGYVKTKETVAFEIFREIERESRRASVKSTIVNCHPRVAAWIYDEESEMLEYLERKHSVRVSFKTQSEYHIEQYEIFTADSYEDGA